MSDHTIDHPSSMSRPSHDPGTADQVLARLYRTKAVPTEIRQGPITQIYGTRADQDTVAARHLREVQNLAAMLTGTFGGDALDEKPAVRHQILTQALGQARRAAIAAGVPGADVQAAQDHGSRGVPWVQVPAHRYLGRIEQLTDQLAAAQRQSAYLYHAASESYQREQNVERENARLRTCLAALTALAEDTTPAAGTEQHAARVLRVVPSAIQATAEPAAPGRTRFTGEGISAAIAAAAIGTQTSTWIPGPVPELAEGTDVALAGREVER